MKRSTYRKVHFRGWPGSDNWRPPVTPEPYSPRLGDRVGLVVVAAAEVGAVPERFGLGAYLVTSGRSILDAGLIVPDGLDTVDFTVWAASQTVRTPSGPKQWSVVTASEFFHPYSGIFTKRAYSGASWCIGPDLGRIFGLMAEHSVPRRGPNQDGWELWMPGWGIKGEKGNVHRVSPHRPCLRVEARRVGWQVSFGPCEKGYGKYVDGKQWRVALLDVLSLAYALDADRGASFGERRVNLGLDPVELSVAVPVDSGGAERMAAAVSAVHELALALDDRASQWFTTSRDLAEGRGRLDLARTVSPGGIAAQVLTRFGVKAPHLTFGRPEPELDAWAESFHGGWCEADPRFLGVPFSAVSLDVSSCFPLVADLIGWWELLCAERVVKRKVTGRLRRLCRLAVEDPTVLLDPAVWRQFGCCLVLVQPNGEVFPVEVEDRFRPDGRLEFVPLSSPDRPVWMCALDVLAAAVKSRQVPDILEATAYIPEGRQAGVRAHLPLLPCLVADGLEGPSRPIVEHRQKLKGQGDLVTAAELRVVVNALVFGNFARMDDIWMREGTAWVRGEKPGPQICLPIASSVTGGSHLLLAILERLVVDKGGVVAYRDTDSSIIPASPSGGDITFPNGERVHSLTWEDIERVLRTFDTLCPSGDLWKCERGEEPTPLRALVFGPKRHVEWVGDSIADFTESDLGGTYAPPPAIQERSAEGYRLWSFVAVERERAFALARGVDPDAIRPTAPWDIGQDYPFPAIRRLMVKTPEMARLLPSCLRAQPGAKYIEANGAVWSGISHDRTVVALDPGGDLSGWIGLPWVDKRTGEPVQVTTDPESPDRLILETLDERAAQWSREPRSKPIDSVVIDPDLIAYEGRVSGVIDADENGLGDLESRRPVYRDADRLPALQKEARRLGYRTFARRADLPISVAKRLANGRPISETNVVRALEALRADRSLRLCALEGCNRPTSRPERDVLLQGPPGPGLPDAAIRNRTIARHLCTRLLWVRCSPRRPLRSTCVSPLCDIESPNRKEVNEMHPRLQDVVDSFQRTMWLPSPWIVYVVLAAVAANRMGSPPVWLLLVGPPSSGKTETLDALSLLPEFLAVSTFTEAGLLSGSSTREGGSATGGLLMELANPGLLVASDMGTLLNEHGSTRNRLFNCLREVFDGKFIRRLGTNGGKMFGWTGHAGFIGACTEAIDSPSIDLGALGERFSYFRLPETTSGDEFMACVVSDENIGHLGDIRRARAELVAQFFENHPIPGGFPLITEPEQERLATLATIGSRCRSSVEREGHSREIELVPGAERAPRLLPPVPAPARGARGDRSAGERNLGAPGQGGARRHAPWAPQGDRVLDGSSGGPHHRGHRGASTPAPDAGAPPPPGPVRPWGGRTRRGPSGAMGTVPMAQGELVGRRGGRAMGRVRRRRPVVFTLISGGGRVAVVRHGWVRGRPVHAAACALCWAGVYDQAEFAKVVLWVQDHLERVHGCAA